MIFLSVWQGIFLGVLQGLTEFLPVSSSGHLFLAEKLLGCEVDVFFNLLLHLGTLFAVVTVMWGPVRKMIFHPITDMRLGMVIMASVPTFVLAAAAELFLPEEWYSWILPAGFIATAVLLFFSDKGKNVRPLYAPPYTHVWAAGIAQGIAVIPGLSRSGSILSVLNFFGVKKEESAEFAFLLSLPVILAGTVVKGYKAVVTDAPVVSNMLPVLLGMLVAYIVGTVCLRLFIGYLKNKSLRPFALYMILPLLLSILTAW